MFIVWVVNPRNFEKIGKQYLSKILPIRATYSSVDIYFGKNDSFAREKEYN